MFPEIRERLGRWFAPEAPVSIAAALGSAKAVTSLLNPSEWYVRNGYYGIAAAASGGYSGVSWAGEQVNVFSAMNHSVVWACRKIISETVGFIPLIMLKAQADPKAGKQLALTHPMYRAMKNSPNDEMTAMTFRETLTGHCLMQGNAFAKIIRRSGTGVAMELQPLPPDMVKTDRNKSGQLVYTVKDGGEQKSYTVQGGKPHDILHLKGLGDNGILGFSVIQVGSQSIGTAIAAEKNVGSFYAHGGRLPYVLETANYFAQREDFEKFRTDWEAVYNQPHRAPILEKDLKYKQIGISAKDSQLLETRLFSIHEICRWFGVPPHLVGDLSRATFSNIEELALEFVKLTLNTWLTRWEQELWRCVLTPEEKAENYLWKHNLNALLRGDFPTRMAGYATMLQNGIASQDEVRDLEDWNPISDGRGSGYHIQLNMQTLPPDGGPLQPPKADAAHDHPAGDPATAPPKPTNKPKKSNENEVIIQ